MSCITFLTSGSLRGPAHGCGTPDYPPSVSRVVNGEDARPYSWPWQVRQSRTYRVVMGEYDLTKRRAASRSGVWRRSLFTLTGMTTACPVGNNDIAMIKLASPVVLNDKVQPSCVPESGEVAPHDDPCYVTGWGRIYSGGPLASAPCGRPQRCSSSVWWGGGGTVNTTMICGGGDIRSGCHGDSGGPLNCRGRDVQGVTSFVSSRGCNTLMKPTVFTRTSSFTKWISDLSILHTN
ncbi:hypothetical protein F7725_028050 [Dissostichus mawsoni]|uniref:Peptidase S1 domain-containing protein n=1 Tax=Dissostichus mawsoni TaxID=36200 RepID=A0A7J5XEN9_DISMA|nr:hypothetical protein F7725_028050 [Dissostichus mawsoni]